MGKVYFLLGVSGAGKTTLFNELDQYDQESFLYIPSYTTRATRPGEVNGKKYRHISKEEFETGIKNNEFLERAFSTNAGMYYGTKYTDMVNPTIDGINTIKETETIGLEKVIKDGRLEGKLVSIFLDIDDETIAKRLTLRGSEEEIQRRTERASMEREMAKKYCDYFIDASRPLEDVRSDFFAVLGV